MQASLTGIRTKLPSRGRRTDLYATALGSLRSPSRSRPSLRRRSTAGPSICLRAARLLPQSEKPVGRQSAPLACGEAACPAHPCVRASEDLRLYSTRKPVPNAGRLCQSARRGFGGKVSSRCGLQAPSRSGHSHPAISRFRRRPTPVDFQNWSPHAARRAGDPTIARS